MVNHTIYYQDWFFAMAKVTLAGTVEKRVKTGKNWQYSYIVCFILVFFMKYSIPILNYYGF